MRGESVDDFEVFVRNEKQLEGVHVNGASRPIRNDESGEVEAAVVIFQDITKRKKAEQQLEQTISELRDRTRLMETVFDNMDEGVAVSDAEGGMLFFNPSAERIVGLGRWNQDRMNGPMYMALFTPMRNTRSGGSTSPRARPPG